MNAQEWSGSPDPLDPDNYWIDDETGERVNAITGERMLPIGWMGDVTGPGCDPDVP